MNSPALEDPSLIDRLAQRFGSQCVVVGIDSAAERSTSPATRWRVHRYTGDVRRSGEADRGTLEWLREAQDRGAGEIVLNCMCSDGVRRGYDIEQLAAARERCHVPLVASGGAGETAHFIEVFRAAGVDAALAASVFHSGELPLPRLKTELRCAGILVRPPTTASRPPCTSPPTI